MEVTPPPAGKNISLLTATCLVVASMVGTGIFTSLGFQVGDLPSGFALLTLWAVGGLCAFCGALSYAELAAALPRSGGEYHFLREIYHPALGFAAGWISATVGFAAPVAIAAIPCGTYIVTIFPGGSPLCFSLGVVWLATAILLWDLRLGARFQNGATLLKIALLLVIILGGFLLRTPADIHFSPHPGDGALVLSSAFATNLFWVMYAYSGWNGATYIAGEIKNPTRAIPWSLGVGTTFVSLLYLGLNAAFLRSTPLAEMAGKQQVAVLAGEHIFGVTGGKIMGLFIALGLVSTVSAMMWVGPRVTVAMGEDLPALRWLARRTSRGVPVRATLLQLAIVHVLVLVSTFQKVVNYVQFSLTLFSTLTVAGVFILRWRRPDLPRPYRTFGYPITPLIFLAISGWMLWRLLAGATTRTPSLWGLATAALGLLIYFFAREKRPVA